jgi:peptidoglycan-associated lipoprotein
MRLPATRSDASAVLAALLAGVVGLFVGCSSKPARYPVCGGDKDCRAGERCIDQRCRQCGDDSGCQSFEHCEQGGCVLDPGACRESSDCADSGVCKANRCSPCQSDVECGPERRCAEGRCLARGGCKEHADCADDEDCVAGRCARPGRDATAAPCTLEPVFFELDTTAVDAGEASAALTRAAECIQVVSGRGVLVEGHTDPRGTEEYNIALSENRAHSVGDYLARLGIDPARFRFVPKGESEASGTDESSWREDRRVEFEWQ